MHIEIRKAGFVNKGAELMLHAVLAQIRGRYPESQCVMVPQLSDPVNSYLSRARLGLLQKAELPELWGVRLADAATVVPKKIRNMYGVVLDKEIDVILDIAGFAYSDQWGARATLELAKASRRWRRRGAKTVLMPQAFGPFKSRISRDAIKEIVGNCDLIFARDRVSYEHIVGITGSAKNVRMRPDFTNLLAGSPTGKFAESNRFCLIPNSRMMDKTSERVRQSYLPFLVKIARLLISQGAKPFLLVHEGLRDEHLADQVSDACGGLQIVKEDDPLQIKGILGACRGTIGSRFHGLVSALSQGVPSLATTWSHKYRELFSEYGFEEGLLDVDMPDSELENRLSYLIIPAKAAELSTKLLEFAKVQRQQSEQMWEEVFCVIEGHGI